MREVPGSILALARVFIFYFVVVVFLLFVKNYYWSQHIAIPFAKETDVASLKTK